MNIVKDIGKVSIANIIWLTCAVITGFIVPAYLTLEQYAYLKTFALILSFAGVFHLGYIDGIYIKYGGKFSGEIDLKVFKTEKNFFILFQFLVGLCIITLGIILKNVLIVTFAIALLPYNLLSYYQFYSQAVAQFNIYSAIRIIIPVLILIFSIILIYFINAAHFLFYVTAEIIVYLLADIYLEFKLSYRIKSLSIKKNIHSLINNFKTGFYIMLGNFAIIIFYTLGRWIVKIFLTDTDFAYYSFATSMMQIVTIVISSIALTFYPYLSRMFQKSNLMKLKLQLIIVGVFLSLSYFIFNLIVLKFIPKYSASLQIIGILFASIPAYSVINALYINLYKVQKDGGKYISVIFINLIVACVITMIAFLIKKSIISIAIGTTIAYYIWLFYSSKDFKGVNPTIKEIVYIILYLIIYFTCVLLLKPFWALTISISLIILLTSIYISEVRELLSKALLLIKHK